ncbi:hypothetical protein FA15DRAFT_755103, partial [Coprinopsis marcescibilis]
MTSDVHVFWDGSALPKPNLDGFKLARVIRSHALRFGVVKGVKLYTDISGEQNQLSKTLRSELQCSGVSVIDTVSAGRPAASSKMMLADIFVAALDNPNNKPNFTMVIITADPDIAYSLSMLRLRGYTIHLICPGEAHNNLSFLADETGFDDDDEPSTATGDGFSSSSAGLVGSQNEPAPSGTTSKKDSGKGKGNETRRDNRLNDQVQHDADLRSLLTANPRELDPPELDDQPLEHLERSFRRMSEGGSVSTPSVNESSTSSQFSHIDPQSFTPSPHSRPLFFTKTPPIFGGPQIPAHASDTPLPKADLEDHVNRYKPFPSAEEQVDQPPKHTVVETKGKVGAASPAKDLPSGPSEKAVISVPSSPPQPFIIGVTVHAKPTIPAGLPAPSKNKTVPLQFNNLVTYLKKHRILATNPMKVGDMYEPLLSEHPRIFIEAGTSNKKHPLRKYIRQAETHGIVTITKKKTVYLNAEYAK